MPACGDLVAQHQHVAAAECDHGVAEAKRADRDRGAQQLHVLLALEMLHRAAFAAQAEQVLDRRHGVGRADDDDLVGRHRDDRLGPGPAARRVEDHLRLVDHGHVDELVGADHLDRAGDDPCAVGRHVLFAGQERGRHAARDQPVAALEREQAQRREVGAVEGLGEPFERGVGLAAVRRADKERDRALQMARLREGVRVALERQLAVEAVEGVEFGDLVLPAVLRP